MVVDDDDDDEDDSDIPKKKQNNKFLPRLPLIYLVDPKPCSFRVSTTGNESFTKRIRTVVGN